MSPGKKTLEIMERWLRRELDKRVRPSTQDKLLDKVDGTLCPSCGNAIGWQYDLPTRQVAVWCKHCDVKALITEQELVKSSCPSEVVRQTLRIAMMNKTAVLTENMQKLRAIKCPGCGLSVVVSEGADDYDACYKVTCKHCQISTRVAKEYLDGIYTWHGSNYTAYSGLSLLFDAIKQDLQEALAHKPRRLVLLEPVDPAIIQRKIAYWQGQEESSWAKRELEVLDTALAMVTGSLCPKCYALREYEIRRADYPRVLQVELADDGLMYVATCACGSIFEIFASTAIDQDRLADGIVQIARVCIQNRDDIVRKLKADQEELAKQPVGVPGQYPPITASGHTINQTVNQTINMPKIAPLSSASYHETVTIDADSWPVAVVEDAKP